MAVPFGFSAGDFIGAIGLIVKVTESLEDIGGASAEYQQVVLQLNGLERTLVHLQKLEPNEQNAEHVNSIRCMALGCLLPLKQFLDQLDKYEKSLAADAKHRHGRNSVRKAQWGVFMEKEITKMRSIISAQVLSINLLLGAHEV